jgi:hypothetical protein
VASSLTARDEFLAQYPEYESPALDELRATGYARLDKARHVYLDYTGASLYADAQVREHLACSSAACLGNPHLGKPGIDGHDHAGRADTAARCSPGSTPPATTPRSSR